MQMSVTSENDLLMIRSQHLLNSSLGSTAPVHHVQLAQDNSHSTSSSASTLSWSPTLF